MGSQEERDKHKTKNLVVLLEVGVGDTWSSFMLIWGRRGGGQRVRQSI